MLQLYGRHPEVTGSYIQLVNASNAARSAGHPPHHLEGRSTPVCGLLFRIGSTLAAFPVAFGDILQTFRRNTASIPCLCQLDPLLLKGWCCSQQQ